MANEKKLAQIIAYLFNRAGDPDAEFNFDVSAPDAAGNRKVEIKIVSRVPAAAAQFILTDPTLASGTANQLYGYGSIKKSPPRSGRPPEQGGPRRSAK